MRFTTTLRTFRECSERISSKVTDLSSIMTRARCEYSHRKWEIKKLVSSFRPNCNHVLPAFLSLSLSLSFSRSYEQVECRSRVNKCKRETALCAIYAANHCRKFVPSFPPAAESIALTRVAKVLPRPATPDRISWGVGFLRAETHGNEIRE